MVKLIDSAMKYSSGGLVPAREQDESERGKTIAYSILNAHNCGTGELMNIKFDALASHDITYVGIIQTARAAGLQEFPVPYVLTNCHNSLCAVGGTINEDDHMFGLSAARKYGGIYVPAHQAVIHAFMREMFAGCGKMILGSDSHTRYGALGTMAIGEGGPELVKQLCKRTYDIVSPKVIAVELTGCPKPGVGPQDVAIALIGAVFKTGFVKNCVLEFIGDGIAALPIEFRNGIDVMTTETTCLSSIWMTDNETERYLKVHKRPGDFRRLEPSEGAYYDGAVIIDLSAVEPMIALPFHPSNAVTIRELNENGGDILRECEKNGEISLGLKPGSLRLCDKLDRATGRLRIDQGVIAGCAGGTFDNLCAAADILSGKSIGDGAFAMSAYPQSQPVNVRLMETGAAERLMRAGVTLRSAFCGPCFGAGDVPANGGISLRHSTRNFPNREGSKPGEGQLASVALADARSIAATAAAGGLLTAATELDIEYTRPDYVFDSEIYEKRVYFGYGCAKTGDKLVFGPNITDWPELSAMPDNLILGAACVIDDDVTTTDELIPSGETSSYRSNPYRLSRFTLSRRDSAYVGRADIIKAIAGADESNAEKLDGDSLKAAADTLKCAITALAAEAGIALGDENTAIGSLVVAVKPGDGSAREQAASCQRVLGGMANLARSYATKRYRSNLINWGMLPLLSDEITIGRNRGKADDEIAVGDWLILPGIRKAIADSSPEFIGYIYHSADSSLSRHVFSVGSLTDGERRILLAGCLTNSYRS